MFENGSAAPGADEVAKAIEVLKRAGNTNTGTQVANPGVPAIRGDSFDIGSDPGQSGMQMQQYQQQPTNTQDIFVRLMQNPESVSGLFGLTPRQARNIRSLIVGGGAGGVHRILADSIGDELAGAIGGFAAAWLAKKIIK